eukprot:283099-Rhodomonas_salina.1
MVCRRGKLLQQPGGHVRCVGPEVRIKFTGSSGFQRPGGHVLIEGPGAPGNKFTGIRYSPIIRYSPGIRYSPIQNSPDCRPSRFT